MQREIHKSLWFFVHLIVLEFLDIMQIPQLHEIHVAHLDTQVQELN